jgi:outer membrane protein assembly factor BamB
MKFQSSLAYLIATMAMISLAPGAQADSWPGFRGAAGTGVSNATNLPTTWSATTNIKWRIDLPGRGNSSPVATKNRIYVTAQTEDLGLWLIAIEKHSGELIWKKQLASGELAASGEKNLYAHRHNPATPTVAASESHVWAFFGTGDLFCLSAAGKQRWHRNLVEDYGDYDIAFGMASSPRVWKGKIYVSCSTKGPSYVLALDVKNGKTLWKKERNFEAEEDGADAYSSPIVWKRLNQEELLVAGKDHLNSYDLNTGEQNWFSAGFKVKSPYGRIIASPAVSPGVIVQCAGNPGGGGIGRAIAIRPGGNGDVTQSGQLWTIERTAPDGATPVCYGDHVYLVRANGITICADLKTGKKLWEERVAQGEYFCSTIAGDNKIYVLGTTGVCTVIEAGPKFNRLATNKLPGTFYASPAISDGILFLRSETSLFAIE